LRSNALSLSFFTQKGGMPTKRVDLRHNTCSKCIRIPDTKYIFLHVRNHHITIITKLDVFIYMISLLYSLRIGPRTDPERQLIDPVHRKLES
jgi:hypothetical protein